MKKGVQKLTIAFEEPALTHYGGMVLIQRFCKKLKIKDLLYSNIKSWNRYIDYHPAELILIIIYTIIIGILRLSGTRILQYNGSFQKFLGLKSFPHASRLNRFLISLDKKTIIRINRIHDQLRLKFFHKPKNRTSVIFDVDSTVLTVYGSQEGAKIGFNPHKRGRPSYQPLLCFEGHSHDYWHGLFRSGNVGSSTNAKQFLEQCFAKIPERIYRIRLRGDSGFYAKEIIEFLDTHKANYAIVSKVYSNTKNILSGLKYKEFKTGYQTAEFYYKPQTWSREHRFIVIRREIPDGPSMQMHLFKMDGYTYQIIVTNLIVSPERVWHFYNNRWSAEQDIKELKENYTLNKIPSKYWNANEAYFHLLLFAYNIINWFKRLCLPKHFSKWNLKTLRTELLVLPAKLVKTQNRNYLKLPKNYVHKHTFLHVLDKIEKLDIV